MKYWNTVSLRNGLVAVGLLLIFSSCERITFEEYSLNPYDGELVWTEVVQKAEWKKRYDHDAAVFNNKIFICGGYNPGLVKGDGYFEDVWSSADGETWEQETDGAPFMGRRGHQLLTFNDGAGEALYLIGGFKVDEETGKRAYENDVWKSTDGKNWTQIKTSTIPDSNSLTDWMPRMHHQCVVSNQNGTNYIYLLGGMSMLSSGIESRYGIKYFNDVWRSSNGIEWTKLSNNSYGIRAEHAAVSLPNGSVLVQGGTSGVIFEPAPGTTIPQNDWQFVWTSTTGETWNKKRDTAQLDDWYLWRSAHEMVYYDDRVWVLPGKTTSKNHYGFTSENHYATWTLDNNDNWALDSKGTAIDARHSYAAVVFKNKIWILGGFTNRNGQANDVWSGELN
jgi:hypothetical protein